MILNFITRHQNGVNCIQPCRIFTEVNDLQVSDHFRALVGPLSIAGDLTPYPCPDGFDVHAYIPRDMGDVKDMSTAFPEQQALLVQFECYGKKYAIWTEMPVYCMNDSGKTIKAYHPVRT